MKKEIKIGLFAVAMIAVAWGGIRFLKGFDIFGRTVDYYAAYDQISGVQSASPVILRGVKIGSVTGISLDPRQRDYVVLRLTIDRRYQIPTDSEAKIFSSSIMGGKSIEILWGEADTFLQRGDTLQSSRGRDLMDMAGSELEYLKQKISTLTTDISRTLNNLNSIMETNAANIASTMSNLNSISGNVAGLLAAEKANLQSAIENLAKFSQTLGDNSGRIDTIVGDMSRFTSSLNDEQVAQKLAQTVDNLNSFIVRLNSGDGTLGMLMDDPALYNSLTQTSDNLAALLADLKQYPARYVHLSLFGRDPEKMKERAEKREQKAAEKAERDSLKNLK